jgi:hypothetical protein
VYLVALVLQFGPVQLQCQLWVAAQFGPVQLQCQLWVAAQFWTSEVTMSALGSSTTYGIQLPYPEDLQLHSMHSGFNCDFIIFKGSGTLNKGV